MNLVLPVPYPCVSFLCIWMQTLKAQLDCVVDISSYALVPSHPLLSSYPSSLHFAHYDIMFYMNASDIHSHVWYHLNCLRATGTMVSILQEVKGIKDPKSLEIFCSM